VAVLCLGIISCSTDFDLTAAPKELLVVYGVLNPQQSTQYIQVSQAFLTEGDALKYAKENDLSVKNWYVALSDGINPPIVLVPVDTTALPGIGDFNSSQTVYRTSEPIVAGRNYSLLVRKPAENEARVVARTTVPYAPFFLTPDSQQTSAPFDYIVVDFERPFSVGFDPFQVPLPPAAPLKENAAAFEVRILLDYGIMRAAGDTVWQERLRYGPTPLITAENRPAGCRGKYCYTFRSREYIDYLNQKLNDLNAKYVFRTGLREKSLQVTVTAIDSFLYNYMLVNNNIASSVSTIRAEYTNIKDGLGVLGAINTSNRYIKMGICSQYLARFNGVSNPSPASCR
jgi:hypothetical protein